MHAMTGGNTRALSRHLPGLLTCCLVGVLLATGCGPSRQEIMAMEKAKAEAEARRRAAAEAKRQAAEARRLAEAARQETIRAAEAAGDEAVRQKRFDKALERYREVLKGIPRYGEQDQRVRQAAIRAAQAMPAPPALSENVLRYMVRGETKVRMGGAGSYDAAAQEMEQAVLEAPWFADGYFNLGTVQDKAGKFNEAIRNFRLFLGAAPQSRNAAAVRARIFGLEVLQEDAIKTVRLMGNWRDLNDSDAKNNLWVIRIKGGKLVVGTGYMQLEKKGLALEGTADFTPHTSNNCTVPGGKSHVTGTISDDGTRMELNYEVNTYNTTSQGKVCIGVSLVGKKRMHHRLVLEEPCKFCVNTEDLSAEKARSLGLHGTRGVLLAAVYQGGPAEIAGLKDGDLLVSCNGSETPDYATFSNALDTAAVGSDVPVTFIRGGVQYDAVVKAGVYLGN